jgi:hypothetical protein
MDWETLKQSYLAKEKQLAVAVKKMQQHSASLESFSRSPEYHIVPFWGL